MRITSELAAKISEMVKDYVNPSDDNTQAATTIALQLGALPIYLDMGGLFALGSTGDVIVIPWEEPQSIKIEHDQRICNIVIFHGSKTYPELESLIPQRPPNAKTCSYCNGSGIAPVPISVSGGHFVCYCGGLGWVP